MKRFSLFAFLLIVFLSSPVRAQSPSLKGLSPECMKYLSYYQEDYKAKNYESAIVNWRKAFSSCPPTVSQNLYVHGTTMMTRLYKETKDQGARTAIADTILLLQDRRMEAFPKKRTDILNNKGAYIINYKKNDPGYVYNGLRDIVGQVGEEASNVILVNLFESSLKQFRQGKITKEDVLEDFSVVSAALDDKKPKDDTDRTAIDQAKGTVSALFADSGLATCDVLVQTFSSRLAADPENVSLVSRIVRMMNSIDDCSSNELYFKAVTTYHRLEPSYKSAYALFRMNVARDNVDEAVRYIEEAIDSEDSDAGTDARFLYNLAEYAYKNKLRQKAADAARRVIALESGYEPSAYIILGNLWASAQASEDVDKYARFWVAYDYYLKAKNAALAQGETEGEGVASDASRLAAGVMRYFPEASEMFMYDLTSGQSYSISLGGLSASTTVKIR